VAVEVPASQPGANPPEDGGDHGANGAARPGASTSRGGPKVTRVVSPTISVPQRLREIWDSRELLVSLVRTEIKVKYKNSVLGLVWSMVAPAMTLAIFFIVFQVILNNKQPNFVIFLFAGLLLWNLFSLGVNTGTGVIVNNAGIVKKVSFPREILALAAVGSACVFFFFKSLVMIVFMVVLHAGPDWSYMPLAVLALLTTVVLACALAILLCCINVYLRDTQHLIEVILTAWFWACPIVYAFQQNIGLKLGPRGLIWIYFLNPMTPLVLSMQRFIYAHPTTYANLKQPNGTYHRQAYFVLPIHSHLWYLALDLGVLAIASVLFLVALAVFGRLEGNFAEEL
jgi:ABC-2 type transport system permease protein